MCFCFKKVDESLCNVIFLGMCFMILFAADFTLANMQKTILSSIHDEDPNFTVEGYTVLGVLYTVFSVTLWLGPSIVALCGIRCAFIFASIGYTFYIIAFNMEQAWAIYSGAMLCGLGAGILWTAEGKYLVLNSEGKLMARNVGVFWVFFALSTFYGNIYTYFELEGKKYIDRDTRRLVVYVLTGISSLSIIMFMLIRPAKKEVEKSELETEDGPITALKKTWSVFTTKDMLTLSIMFLYVGMQQAFVTGIYSPCVGFTLKFGDASKQLIPLSGLFCGVGSLIGGSTQILMSDKINKYSFGRSTAALVGFVSQLIAFLLIFLNLPNSSVFNNTEEEAIIESSIYIALLCSILLGLGDSCYNTQIYSLIAVMFPKESAQSCALYTFTKGILVSTTFYFSNHVGLHKQLATLATGAIIAALIYCYIDQKTVKTIRDKKKLQEQPDITEPDQLMTPA
ncbi:UNC93-like protein MFSD11 [Lycorma delicatula]|uniref:UNC93-like protein MFSD11 n=1 Tax=Lycorma delicatula TaxID=130591 RepID=UPI003F50D6B5